MDVGAGLTGSTGTVTNTVAYYLLFDQGLDFDTVNVDN